jgi:hypothetical protein
MPVRPFRDQQRWLGGQTVAPGLDDLEVAIEPADFREDRL